MTRNLWYIIPAALLSTLILAGQAESTLATDHDVAELECFAPNRASIAFYESRGYTTVRAYYEAASGVNRVVMTKPLSS